MLMFIYTVDNLMTTSFILSLDLGTTGNRVFCYDGSGRALSMAYREFRQIFPYPGWVEHDPEEIWSTVQELIPEALGKAGLQGKDAITIGITNQRETVVLWDRHTGRPVHNAIVWQCRRTASLCNELKNRGLETMFRNRTGLVLDAYFSGTKIQWLLDNVPGARDSAARGDILAGTIDTWILWKLTGGASHLTDFTNASRTLLYDIKNRGWSRDLCEILTVPMNILPSVQDSASAFGCTRGVAGLPDGIPVGGMAGDQQAALVGQNCVFAGDSKNTYGTGCFILQNNGDTFSLSGNGLLTTLACDRHGKPAYALEGSVFIGGAVIQWLRDYLELFHDNTVTEEMALSASSPDEVVFIPAFVGLGAPYWKMDARGAIFGLTRDTSREQIVRAALKSIAHQSRDVLEALQHDTGRSIKELRADGGATANHYLMQFQADIMGIPVLIPANAESTALGAAYLAGLTAGLFNSIDEIANNNIIKNRYEPRMDNVERGRQIRLWKEAIARLL